MNIICLASYFKGEAFLRECKRRGAHVTLLTREATLGENWPRESIDEIIPLPATPAPETTIEVLSELGRGRRIDRLVALEEYDVITAALAREHFCLAGMSGTTARHFRDKLAVRAVAREAGISVPEFVHALNRAAVADFLGRVSPPWMLKPRSDVSAVGIQKLHQAEEVWRALDGLDARDAAAERSSFFLLEQYLAGEVYHVDSLVQHGAVVFAAASRYGRPPIEVAHGGGVFLSSGIKRDSEEEVELLGVNRAVLAALGLKNGAAHAEFIRRDGRFYFLEVGARVGGAFLAETIEAATGVNLWREWAQIELADGEETRVELPASEIQYSGIALSLARQEYPDTSAYDDPEIAYRVAKRYHVGLIVRSPRPERVAELLANYAARFQNDFCAVLPPLQRPH